MAAEREDDLQELCRSVSGQAELLVQLGRAEEAERKLRVTLALGANLPQQGRYWLNSALGEVLRQDGRPLEARSAYQEAARLADLDHVYHLVNKANLGITELALGDAEAARRWLEPVRDGMAGGGTLFEATVEAIWLAVLAELGRHEELADRLDRTLAMVEQRGVTEKDVGWALQLAGEVSARAGHLFAAVRCLAAALRLWETLDLDPLKQSCREQLRELRERGAPVPVGPWLLERKLGEGGMGEVWLAQHSSGPLAVKLLRREGGRRLEEEVRAAAGLDHPYITEPLELIEAGPAAAAMLEVSPRAPVLAMELAEDGSLRERAGHMRWEALRGALDQLLQALAHAHGRGIVHLDIKPENVLVHRGEVRLADFGLARAFGDQAERISGTPAFMAPEAIRGRELGPATDLYMVGCLAWCMAAARLPFEGAPMEVLKRQVRDPLPPLQPWNEVPADFEDWVRWLTRKRAEERPPTAAMARAALLALGRAEAPRRLELPADWRLPRRGRSWAGASLFRWRRWPVVGRDGVLDALWEEARLASLGQRRVVCLLGPPGSGRSHLLRELRERLDEVGVGSEGLELHLEELPQAHRYLELRPVGPAAARGLVRSLLPLAPVLESEVLRLADADPAFLVELLTSWVEQGWLGPSTEGLVLRPGCHAEQLPASLRAQAVQRVAEEDRLLTELIAVLGEAPARELGRACRLADLDPPRPGMRRLQERGLLRQRGGRWLLSPVVRLSFRQRAREEGRAEGWHLAASQVLEQPARKAHHLLQAGLPEQAAPLLLQGLDEVPAEQREQVARDGLLCLDLLLVGETDPRRRPLHQAALNAARQRGDRGAEREHRKALERLDQGR